jgi:hypothetical protein
MGKHYDREFYEVDVAETKHNFTAITDTPDGVLTKGEVFDCFDGLVSGVSSYRFDDTQFFKYTPQKCIVRQIQCK